MNTLDLTPLSYTHSLLAVDDEDVYLDMYRLLFADKSYELHTANCAEEGLRMLRKNQAFSLIISDQKMPGMTGVEFFSQAREICPQATRVLLTGFTDTDAIIDAINSGGIHLYLNKPFHTNDLMFQVNQLLAKTELIMKNRKLDELVKKKNDELLELNKNLERKVQIKTKDLAVQAEALRVSCEKISMILEGTVLAMSKIVESRDPYTAGHEQQVARIACLIAQNLSLPADQIESIRIAASLHDIGKIAVPSEILTKPGRLSKLEMEMVKIHSQNAYEILKNIAFPYPIADIILQHHERLDGSGYPNGLSGAEILLEARIIGVADVIEAMSSHRPYRPALGIDAAFDEITKHSGALYDPAVVQACIAIYQRQSGDVFLQKAA